MKRLVKNIGKYKMGNLLFFDIMYLLSVTII